MQGRDLSRLIGIVAVVLALGLALALAGAAIELPGPAYGDARLYYWHAAAQVARALTPLSLIANTGGLSAWPARWAAWTLPAAFAAAVLYGLWMQTRNTLRAQLIAARGGHTVVAGLSGGGLTFARSLLSHRRPVLALVSGEDEAAARALQGPRFATLARQETRMARGAGLARAQSFAAVTDDDARNFEQAAAALAAADGAPLKLSLRLEDIALRGNAQDELAEDGRNARINLFSADALTARAFFAASAPDRFAPLTPDAKLRIVIMGFGALGQEMLLAYLRLGWLTRGGFAYTVIDHDAARLARDFQARYPGAEALAPIRFHTGDLEDEPEIVRLLTAEDGALSAIFICLSDAKHALALALRSEQMLRRKLVPLPPIYLAGVDDAAVSPLRHAAAIDAGRAALFQGLYDEDALFDCDFLLQGRLDQGARAVHEDYLSHYVPKDKIGTRPQWRHWDDLSEEARDDNRAVASHMAIKLRDLGLRLVAKGSPAIDGLTDEMVEALSRAEHARWLANRVLAGWRHGETRDDAAKRHPDIVPYDALSEATKEKDRSQVRALSETVKAMKMGVAKDFRLVLTGSGDALPPAQKQALTRWLQQRARAEAGRQTVVISTLLSAAERDAAETALACGAALWVIAAEPVYAIARRMSARERGQFCALLYRAERIRTTEGETPEIGAALNTSGFPAHAAFALTSEAARFTGPVFGFGARAVEQRSAR